MKKIISIFLFLAIFLMLGYFFINQKGFLQAYFSGNEENKNNTEAEENTCAKIEDTIKKIEIVENSTYGELMSQASTSSLVANEIYNAAQPLYDLVKIRQGRFFEFVFDGETDKLKEFIYKIDSEDELHVKKIISVSEISGTTSPETTNENWKAEITPIPYTTKIKTVEGKVESSMYQAAIDNDIDIRAIIELANAFQWTIDFAMDPRVDDTFKFIYEERYLDGEYVMPGQILAGKYVNDGQPYEVYYFEETEDNIGFFDQDGNSVQKMFLKAPVAFKYISSGYTTGNRVIMEYGLTGPHRAIDYAAPIGTPIRTVGDGTVIFAGWKTGYGNFTSIRHNGTYTTNYAHQSKFAVKVGQKVTQGQTIGYVGSTGYSTGPHLHFEMVKNGAKINPLKEILPPGEPIKEENQERFFNEIKKYQEILTD